MKKLLLLLIATLIATPAFALPSLKSLYYSETSNAHIVNFEDAKRIGGYIGVNTCAFGSGKFIQKSAKNFEIKFDDLDGMNCVDRDITKLKGTILKTKNDTITKFKILGKNDFSGVYLIQE